MLLGTSSRVADAEHSPDISTGQVQVMVVPAPPHSWGLRRASARHAVWALLGVWTLLWSAMHAQSSAYSWHYFSLGARLLTSPSTVHGAGVHLYTGHPELQIGPLTFVIAEPFQALGATFGSLLAIAALALLGLGILAVLVSTAELNRSLPDSLVLVAGLLVVPVWAELATHYTHLDDGLALGFAVLALRAVRTGRPIPVGLFLAASLACKPWAIGFLPLLLALPVDRRVKGLLVTLAGAAVAWLPFVVGDPGTLSAGQFAISNAADSALRVLGVSDPSTPSWDRLAQLGLALGVGVVLVRRRQWSAVLLAVVAARMLLDPQTYPYYTAGLVVAAAAVDLLRPGRQFPLWTAGAFFFYVATGLGKFVLPPHDIGLIRAAYLAGMLAVLVVSARTAPVPPTPGSPSGTTPPPPVDHNHQRHGVVSACATMLTTAFSPPSRQPPGRTPRVGVASPQMLG